MKNLLIGVISDTHGLLRPQALEALAGADLIVHAGDIGNPQILRSLGEIAPVHAVRGNTDRGDWAWRLPRATAVAAGDTQLFVLHNLYELDLDPQAAGFAAVLSGHTHAPAATRKNGVLFLNPGSAGPRRFTLPVTLALLRIQGRDLQPEIVNLLQICD